MYSTNDLLWLFGFAFFSPQQTLNYNWNKIDDDMKINDERKNMLFVFSVIRNEKDENIFKNYFCLLQTFMKIFKLDSTDKKMRSYSFWQRACVRVALTNWVEAILSFRLSTSFCEIFHVKSNKWKSGKVAILRLWKNILYTSHLNATRQQQMLVSFFSFTRFALMWMSFGRWEWFI